LCYAQEEAGWMLARAPHMAAPSPMTTSERREPFPTSRPKTPERRLSGDLILLASLVGIGRALFGTRKQGEVQRGTSALQDTFAEGGRGRTADKDIPAKGWKDIAWRVYDGIQNDRVLLISAGVTFYALLALFPTTAAIVSLYGLFADANTINEHLQLIAGFLPQGALEVIGDQVKRIASQPQGTLSIAFFGTLALSLWGANAGTKAIFDALNIIYKEPEKRGFIGLTLASLVFTLGAIVVVVVAMAAIVAAPVALRLLSIPSQSGTGWLAVLRWPLLYVVILFALACLYRYGPSRTKPQWRWVSWGSAIAGGVWIMGSLLLSWYVANFGTYNATYGSLGAVIGFMIWMWISIIVLLAGAEINAEMEHQTARDTTEGGDNPMGARGARMADEVGPARA
jgi:membrane protein